MSCKEYEKTNEFQKEREKFNEMNQKNRENSNGDDLRKVEHPERFDFFGSSDQN